MEPKRVLAVGINAQSMARELWPEAVIDTADLKPSKRQTDYDVILLYMVLPRYSYLDIVSTMLTYRNKLRKDGEINIFCPSLEWAAKQVLAPEPSQVFPIVLWGNQIRKEFFLGGYTMKQLRDLLDKCGFATKNATTGEYLIGEIAAEMHFLRAKKWEHNDPGLSEQAQGN